MCLVARPRATELASGKARTQRGPLPLAEVCASPGTWLVTTKATSSRATYPGSLGEVAAGGVPLVPRASGGLCSKVGPRDPGVTASVMTRRGTPGARAEPQRPEPHVPPLTLTRAQRPRASLMADTSLGFRFRRSGGEGPEPQGAGWAALANVQAAAPTRCPLLARRGDKPGKRSGNRGGASPRGAGLRGGSHPRG